MTDWLDSLGRDEQALLIERLRRGGSGKPAQSLVPAPARGGVPAEVLASALLRAPSAQVVAYLAGAEAALREHVLTAAPARLRRELEEELRLRGPSDGAEFLEARRDILARLRDETARRDSPSTEVRRWANGPPARPPLAAEVP